MAPHCCRQFFRIIIRVFPQRIHNTVLVHCRLALLYLGLAHHTGNFNTQSAKRISFCQAQMRLPYKDTSAAQQSSIEKGKCVSTSVAVTRVNHTPQAEGQRSDAECFG